MGLGPWLPHEDPGVCCAWGAAQCGWELVGSPAAELRVDCGGAGEQLGDLGGGYCSCTGEPEGTADRPTGREGSGGFWAYLESGCSHLPWRL